MDLPELPISRGYSELPETQLTRVIGAPETTNPYIRSATGVLNQSLVTAFVFFEVPESGFFFNERSGSKRHQRVAADHDVCSPNPETFGTEISGQ